MLGIILGTFTFILTPTLALESSQAEMAVCSNACIALREALGRKQVVEPLVGGEESVPQTA